VQVVAVLLLLVQAVAASSGVQAVAALSLLAQVVATSPSLRCGAIIIVMSGGGVAMSSSLAQRL